MGRGCLLCLLPYPSPPAPCPPCPPPQEHPYHGDVALPLIVRGPGVPTNSSIAYPTVHVDLAPTWLELATAKSVGPPLDGKSLVPLLGGSPPAPVAWRTHTFSEHFGGEKGQLTWMSIRAGTEGEAMHW